MRPPAGSARRLAATCSFSRRTSASASNSSLRARRYSLDFPGEVDIRVEEHFPPLVHVAWFALESHFHSFLCSELSPLWRHPGRRHSIFRIRGPINHGCVLRDAGGANGRTGFLNHLFMSGGISPRAEPVNAQLS